MKFRAFLFLFGSCLATGISAFGGVKSRRDFHETPYGQIHYRYGGDFIPASSGHSASDGPLCCTFLMLHGNPRSSDEFRELVGELSNQFVKLKSSDMKLSFSFIAMDMFGEGQSDDSTIQSSKGNDSYVSMEEYADFMLEIASKVLGEAELQSAGDLGHLHEKDDPDTRYIVSVGSLTGTAIATELSYKLTTEGSSLPNMRNCRVLSTVLHDPMYYFTDSIVAGVHGYAAMERNWQPKENGQHLTDIWNDPNYQPFKDLDLQDRKSLDRFRAAKTQWQVILGYADYSSKLLLGRMTSLSKKSERGHYMESSLKNAPLPLLILYGGEFLYDPTNNKIFRAQEMKSLIWSAVQGGAYEKVIDGGNQALFSQNVTVVADIIIQQVLG